MIERPDECDMLFCNSTRNVQNLTKYIFVCESCWFMIMNGVKKLNSLEEDHLIDLEKERKEKDNGVI